MKATNIVKSPSFLKGIARTLDLFGSLDQYKYSDDPDAELIRRDWNSIGDDLKSEIKRYGKKASPQSC